MRSKHKQLFIHRNCRQCGSLFKLTAADLEETDVDHRFCTDECEEYSRKIDEAEIRREERECE